MIELLFYRGISPISRFIRWQTRSSVSHVAIRREEDVIQAWHKPFPWGEVSFTSGENAPFANHTSGTEIEVYTVPRLAEEGGDWIEDRVWKWALGQIGAKYDFRMVVRFLPRLKETKSSREKLFCSELVAMAFVIGCYPLLERIPASYVAPGMLRTSPLLDYQHTMKTEGEGVVDLWIDKDLAVYDRAHAYEQEL